MLELLWLLLPIAAASGWYTAKWSQSKYRKNASPNIPSEYIQGINYLVDEKPDKALEVFIRFVEVDSDTVETHVVLGNLFRQRGEVDRAIRIHQNLIARPNLARVHRATAMLELGRDYLKAGLLDRAEELFKEIIAIGLHKGEAHRHLKELYEQEKDWEKAIENALSLQGTLSQKQDIVIAHYYCELGERAIKTQQKKIAEKMAKKALSYDRNCVRASILLGDLSQSKGDFKAAIRHYGNVHNQNPKFISVTLPLIKKAYKKNGDPQGYQYYLQRIQHDHCEEATIMGLIESYTEQNDIQGLESLLDKELNKPAVPLRILRKYIQYQIDGEALKTSEVLLRIARVLDSHLEVQISHKCVRCGFEMKGMYWQCPSCHGWGTIHPRDDNKNLKADKKTFIV